MKLVLFLCDACRLDRIDEQRLEFERKIWIRIRVSNQLWFDFDEKFFVWSWRMTITRPSVNAKKDKKWSFRSLFFLASIHRRWKKVFFVVFIHQVIVFWSWSLLLMNCLLRLIIKSSLDTETIVTLSLLIVNHFRNRILSYFVSLLCWTPLEIWTCLYSSSSSNQFWLILLIYTLANLPIYLSVIISLIFTILSHIRIRLVINFIINGPSNRNLFESSFRNNSFSLFSIV